VGIDMIAGPERDPGAGRRHDAADWVAMDLFSQAEHDELAQSILLCPDAGLHRPGAGRHRPPDDGMPRRDVIIRASLEGRGALILTRSMEEACAISNRIAPEHLEVSSATRTAGSRCCATPARSSWAPSPARAWATTAPAPTTCCPLGHRPFLLAAGGVRLPEAQQPDRGERGAGPAPSTLGLIAAEAGLRRRACRPTRRHLTDDEMYDRSQPRA
jgi:hypothetical protein